MTVFRLGQQVVVDCPPGMRGEIIDVYDTPDRTTIYLVRPNKASWGLRPTWFGANGLRLITPLELLAETAE